MAIQITIENNIPEEFYSINPDHDILTFDYQDAQNVEDNIIWDNGTINLSNQKHIILNALKSCQRLLRTYPDDPNNVDYSTDNFVTVLYEIAYRRGVEEENLISGFRSAHQIAAISEDNFVRNFPDGENIIDKQLARRIHSKAVNIKQRVALKQSGLKDSTASPHYSATAFNNVQGDLIQYQQALPDYENMFGSQEMIACDESRSALSPAAYFVDMMHLADQYIKQAEEAELTLQFRRPDLWNIPLDKDHTYTMVPYLEIVNNVLKNNLDDRLTESNGEETDSLYAAATSKYPFNLPFRLPLEKIRAYLAHFDIDLPTLFQLFEDAGTPIDREKLGLSLEEFNLLALPDASETNLKAVYGIHDSKESLDDLKKVAVFLDKTGLTAAELEELLFQNLRQKTDLASDNHAVLSLNGMDDYAALDSFHYSNEDSVDVITIETWIKTGKTTEGVIISFDRNEYFRLSIGNDQGFDQERIYWATTALINDTKDIDELVGQTLIADSQWHHVAVTYDASSGKKEIFVDGQLDIETTAHLGTPLGTNKTRFGFIGVGSETSNFDGEKDPKNYFDGQMSDLRIWSVARKKTDIQADMNRRLTGKEDHLIGYWRLDEGTGNSPYNLIAQSSELLHAESGWTEDTALNLPGNEYQPLLFQNLFINKSQPSGKFLSVQKQFAANGDATQAIINLDDTAKDRLHRFIRLAKKLEWSFADLDYILCSIAASDIDDTVIQTLAKIKDLQDRSGWSLEVLGSLWQNLKTYGMGNDTKSQTLFDRIFNAPNAKHQPNGVSYHPAWSANPLYLDAPLSWTVHDKESADARQLRKWLQGSLKIKDSGLTSIANYLFPVEEGADPMTLTIELTVENLSLLHRFAKLPKLLDVPVSEFLLATSILGDDFPTLGSDMIDEIGQLADFTDWLKNADLSVFDWQYLTSGEPGSSVDVGYAEADVAPFIEELRDASTDWLLSDGAAITIETDNETQPQDIWNRLYYDRYIDGDGILFSDYFQYTNSLWYLFQLREDSFIGKPISADDSQTAFQSLKYNGYVDDLGNLKAAFSETTNLGFLFTGDANAAAKQEAVRAILVQLQQFYSYFQFSEISFISGTISKAGSKYVFDQLIENGVLFDNGTFDEDYDTSTDLSYLFKKNTKKKDTQKTSTKKWTKKGSQPTKVDYQFLQNQEANTAEIEALLAQTKEGMATLETAIGDLLNQYYESQKNGTLEYLNGFFGTKTDLTESVLNYSVRAEDVPEFLQLLLSPQAFAETQSEFIAAMARVFYVSNAMEIGAEEWQNITLHPEWFDLSGGDISTVFSTETLQSLTTFKQLQKDLGDKDNTLLQYFANENGQREKNEALANMTGWEQSQVEYLLNSDYLRVPQSNYPDDVKTADNVSTVNHLYRFFAMATPIGSEVQFLEELRQLENLPADTEANWQTAQDLAHSLIHTLLTHYTEEEWAQKFGPIREILLEKERNALAGWLIWILSETYTQVRTLDDLYDLLLIDVKMGGCMDVSYIKEAINAVQLYIHRCQTHLEADVTNKIPKDWWSWMEHYRIWEANRKIFLHPENYLDPALRKSKTPIFKELEDELMQQPVTDDAVSQALQNYFDKFADLAHLKIADSYFCKVTNSETGAEEDTLFLFGATRSQPQTYYYRTAVLDPATMEVQTWRPWQKVNMTITAEYVTPVFAFEKLFLFWVETTTKPIRVGYGETSNDGRKADAEVTKATIKFSFQKKDGGWMVPQSLAADLVINVSNNLLDDNSDYTSNLREAVGINLDLSKTYWKKVYARRLPEKGAKTERLAILFGELISTTTDDAILVPEYLNTDSPEQNEFNNMLSTSGQFCFEADAGNYSTLVPAFILDSGFLIEQKQIVVNSQSESSATLVADYGNRSIKTASSDNAFADNYMSGYLSPGLTGYWPLAGSVKDKAGRNDGIRRGGKWVTITDNHSSLADSREVLDFDGTTNSYVMIQSFDGLANNQFAIEFWVKSTNDSETKNEYILRACLE